jgi:sulfite exporter TauE/SafE
MVTAMEKLDLVSLFLLGLFGTGHCVGMCGPLVFALPGQTGRFVSHLAYHGGRLGTYTLIGFLMGGLGAGLARLFAGTESTAYLKMLAQIQVAFSLIAGVFLVLFGLAQLGLIKEPGWMAVAVPEKIPGYRKIVRTAFTEGGDLHMLLIGFVMGFLPCGLSFAAFSRALATASPVKGGLCLVAFGLGTLPGLLFIGTGASHIARRYRRQSDILSGMLMLGMGLMLLAKAAGTLT